MVNIASIQVSIDETIAEVCLYICHVIKKQKVMKTMKQFITVIAILLGLQVFAASEIQIRTNGNTEVIIESDEISNNQQIRIFDEEGTLLFFEKISEDKYLKTFSLSTLPNGRYFVEYENDEKTNTAVIIKSENNILTTSDFNKISFKPIVKQDGDFLNVGITNPKFEDVDMIFTDTTGYELLEINNLKGLFVKKTFNTKKLPAGDYSLQIKCGDKSFTKMVSIQ